MHIVYIIAKGGGPEAYVRALQPWLEMKGVHVSVVSLHGSMADFSKNVHLVSVRPFSISIHYFLSKIPFFRDHASSVRAYEQEFAIYSQLKKIEKIRSIDLIEITEGFPLNILSKFWKVVVRAHGSDWTFHHFCQDGKRNIQDGIDLEKKQLSRAVAVSPLSEHLAGHLESFCNISRENLKVLPYPIDTDFFFPGVEVPKEPALMIVGRLEKRKGTDTLFGAMSKVWEIISEVKLYVLGGESGFTRKDLLELIPRAKHSQVIFPGFVSRAEIPAYYKKMTFYVAPTQYETFGYTILEAMACGLPVISCNVGAVPELVQDGQNGYLIPFDDAQRLSEVIISLFLDKDKCKRMGEESRRRALKYHLDQVGERTLEFYRQALNK